MCNRLPNGDRKHDQDEEHRDEELYTRDDTAVDPDEDIFRTQQDEHEEKDKDPVSLHFEAEHDQCQLLDVRD